MSYPWHQPILERILAGESRLHHALLIAGAAGGGAITLADALAARLLCRQPQGVMACGQCQSCQWLAQGSHPGLVRIVPDSEQEDEAGEAADGKRRSSQIRIEQVRSLGDILQVGASDFNRRLVLLDPAEAMNLNTANALLKLLEEPPPGVNFLLVTASPQKLLPTIRSRCQVWSLPLPDRHDALRWLADRGVVRADELLAICGGDPVAAAELHRRGVAEALTRFVRETGSLSRVEAVRLAAGWDAWLKTREAQAMGLDLPRLVDWLLRWTADLNLWVQARRQRFFPAARETVSRQAENLDVRRASRLWQYMLRMQAVARHPLNTRLFLEDLLLNYQRVLRNEPLRVNDPWA